MTESRVLTRVGDRNSPKRNNGGRESDILAPGQYQTLISVEADDNSGAEMLCVTLGAVSATADNAKVPKMKALVKWGADGALTECEIDWKLGCLFAVPAGCLQVTAYNEDITGLSGSVRAFVGYGTRPDARPTTRTITTSSNALVPIPSFAVGVWITTPSAAFEFNNSVGATLCQGGANPAAGQIVYAPIPNGACYVSSVINTTWIFELSL